MPNSPDFSLSAEWPDEELGRGESPKEMVLVITEALANV